MYRLAQCQHGAKFNIFDILKKLPHARFFWNFFFSMVSLLRVKKKEKKKKREKNHKNHWQEGKV